MKYTVTKYLLAVIGAGAMALGSPKVIEVGNRRQVFIDGKFLDAASDIRLEVKRPIKRGIILEADDPTLTSIGQYGSILEYAGVFHMWYQAGTVVPGAAPGNEDVEGYSYLCYAKSTDGVHWIKPHLDLAEPIPGGEPNIVMGGKAGEFPADMGAWNGGEVGNVFIDPTAPAAERFRVGIRQPVLSKEPGKFGLHVMSSPDGIHWRLTHRDVVNYWSPKPHLDTSNVLFWDGDRQTYRAYVRFNMRLPGGRNRAVAYAESPDLDHFAPVEQMQIVFAHDGLDASLYDVVAGRELRMDDFYTSGAMRYPLADEAYYMFPSAYFHYESVLPEFRNEKPVNAGILDIRFGASRDGVAWQRFDRRPYVRQGVQDHWDSRMLYMYTGLLPVGESKLLMCYFGSDWNHGWGRNDDNRRILRAAGGAPVADKGAIGLLELRRDGFVSVRADYTGGEFTTPLIRFSGNELVLNIDTSAAGEARVELQDESGNPLPGFALADCRLIHSANQVNHRVIWLSGSNLSSAAGRPVRLRIVMRDTELYAFQFRDQPGPSGSAPHPHPDT